MRPHLSKSQAAQRRRRRWRWRGEEGARRPGPEAQDLRRVLRNALRKALCRILNVLAAAVLVVVREGGPNQMSSSSRTGGRTCTHPERQRGLREAEAGAWSASEKRTYPELQLTGLWLWLFC